METTSKVVLGFFFKCGTPIAGILFFWPSKAFIFIISLIYYNIGRWRHSKKVDSNDLLHLIALLSFLFDLKVSFFQSMNESHCCRFSLISKSPFFKR